MPDTLLPQLEESEAREAVAEAVMAIFSRWGLHEVNQARLLGLSNVLKIREKFREADQDILERAGYLLAIDRGLLKRYPLEPSKRDRWVFTANDNLDGLTPLAVMLEKGTRGIAVIKALVESRG